MTVATSVRSFCSRLPSRLAEPRCDGELLRAFADRRDEAAFAALLRRHAAMVRGVCHRVLGDGHLAEDAAQAAFLVLARRRGTAAQMSSLGGWLHEVARRCALKLRAKHSSPLPPAGEPEASSPSDGPVAPALLAELRRALDEEIRRLNARQREAVVLHYLEGLSYAETAARLGWPRGTLATRLSQARAALRERLTARGFDLSSVEAWGVIALAVCPITTAPAWGEGLVRTALTSDTHSPSVVSPEAVRLSQEVMTMNLTTWKLSLACAGLLGVIGLAAGQQLGTQPGPSPAAETPATRTQPAGGTAQGQAPTDPKREYLELLRKRVDGMSAEEVQAALAREREADRERRAAEELDEILSRLKALAENYSDTRAAATALSLLRMTSPDTVPAGGRSDAAWSRRSLPADRIRDPGVEPGGSWPGPAGRSRFGPGRSGDLEPEPDPTATRRR